MLKQGRQIPRKRSSQSNSLADGRYDRLEEETSQPPYLPLSLSRPDLGVCRDRTVVFGQNPHGRVGRRAFCFFLGYTVRKPLTPPLPSVRFEFQTPVLSPKLSPNYSQLGDN